MIEVPYTNVTDRQTDRRITAEHRAVKISRVCE